jgi:hypothetical protein
LLVMQALIYRYTLALGTEKLVSLLVSHSHDCAEVLRAELICNNLSTPDSRITAIGALYGSELNLAELQDLVWEVLLDQPSPLKRWAIAQAIVHPKAQVFQSASSFGRLMSVLLGWFRTPQHPPPVDVLVLVLERFKSDPSRFSCYFAQLVEVLHLRFGEDPQQSASAMCLLIELAPNEVNLFTF